MSISTFFITVLNRNETNFQQPWRVFSTSRFLGCFDYVLCQLLNSFLLIDFSHNLMLFFTYCLGKEIMIFIPLRNATLSSFSWIFQSLLTHLLPFWTPASHKIFSLFRFLLWYDALFFLCDKYCCFEYFLIPICNSPSSNRLQELQTFQAGLDKGKHSMDVKIEDVL